MPTKIRLQRHGKKGKPYFHIIASDNRAKRDGKYIERLGSYNPTTNPATIEVNFERCLHWIKCGAVPTDTARAILSYKGVLYKSHLDRGVLKGAHTQEQANAKFEKWLGDKDGIIGKKVDILAKAKAKELADRLKVEGEQREAKEKEVLAKTSDLADEVVATEASIEGVEVEATTVAEDVSPEVEATAEVTEEAPAAEVVTEEPVAEAVEVVEEAPSAEVVTEEPAAEATEEVAEEASKEEEKPAEPEA